VDWLARRSSPSVKVLDVTNGELQYKDGEPEGMEPVSGGQRALMHAFGTTSGDFFESVIAQLKRTAWKNTVISERDLNLAIGLITHFEPENHVDLVLAAQIAAVHLCAMRFVPELTSAQTREEIELYERAVTRLFRTSTMLVDSYVRRKASERTNRPARKPLSAATAAPEPNARTELGSAEKLAPGIGANDTRAPMSSEKHRMPQQNGSGACHASQTSPRTAGRSRSH
jgi:hypothetical protein